MLVVNADLKVKNTDELIALSKAKPGTLSYLTADAPADALHGDDEEGAAAPTGSACRSAAAARRSTP